MLLRRTLLLKIPRAACLPSSISRGNTFTTTARLPTPFSLRHRPLLLLLTSSIVGLSLPFLTLQSAPPTQLDTSSPAPFTSSSSSSSYNDARTSRTKNSKTLLNPVAVKQISLGSILGLGAGVLVSAFSKTLTLVFGVGIVIVQYAARKGYNVVPMERMQRYVRGVNLRSAINDNVAFKISFGLTFALAAFAGF